MKKRIFTKILAPVLASVMLFSACSSADNSGKIDYASISDVEFWAAYSSEKVLQDNVDIYDSIKRTPVVDVTAIRGEEEATQIIMTAGDKAVKEYDVVLSDLSGANGAKFEKENIKVYHERYIFVGLGAEYYTESGYYPDCLVPFENVKAVGETGFKANNNQGLYISFDVPENQPAGVYTGDIKIKISGGVKTIPVTLNVSSVTIGAETHVLSSFLNEWYFYRGELDTTEEMFDTYNKFLFDYRLGCNNVTVYSNDVEYYAEKVCEYAAIPECAGYNIPWFGKNYKDSHYKIYDHYDNPNGITDRELNVQHSYDVDKMILYLETIAYEGLEQNVDPFKKAFVYGWDEPDLSFKERAAGFIKEWSYIVKQCKNIVVEKLKADETIQDNPLLPTIIDSLGKVQHLVLSSSYVSQDIDTELEDTTYGPYFSRLGTEGLRNQYRHGEDDHTLWWYGCVAPDYPYPTYHIDDTVLSARLESWMKADYNIQGNLYWSTCLYSEPSSGGAMVYPEDFYSGNAARSLGTNGEGFLLYPGKKYGINGPVPSLRLEHIRDGLEEYEMIYALENVYNQVSAQIGEDFTADKFMRYIYDQVYTGTQVGTTSENFEKVRELLLGVCELGLSNAKVCITDVKSVAGGYTFNVFAADGYDLKQSGNAIPNSRAVAGGKIYTFSVNPDNGERLALSVEIDGRTYSINMSFGSSSQSYNAEYAYDNGIITKRYLGVDTELVDAITVNPSAGATEKYVQIKLAQSESTVWHDFIIEDEVITKLSKKDNKFTVRIYNASSENVMVTLAIKYNSKYKTRSTNELLPGMNEISISNIESLKWGTIKKIESVRFIVDPEVSKAAARDCLYFVDMSVYQK